MTLTIGLIGYPLSHSISPIFQQAALDALGVAARYEAWETSPEQLGQIAQRLRLADCLGANVTIPHKQAIMGYLDEVHPTARAVGAVNTIVHRHDRLEGYNTDVEGFTRSIRRDGGRELAGATVAVLGAGGAARGVVAAAILAKAGAVTVVARRTEPARVLIDDLGSSLNRTGQTSLEICRLDATDRQLTQVMKEIDILVNATPVGTGASHPNLTPLPPDLIPRSALVCDLVYNPPITLLLRLAAERGAATLNGLPMLVYQGAAAFEMWTGQPAPIDLMRRAAEEALGG